jgi:hypothetical protein
MGNLMTLKEQMAADLLNLILNTDEFAESSTYTAKGGTAKTIKAVWEYDNFGAEFEAAGESWKKRGTVTVSIADIADPQRGDSIVNAAGESFEVQDLQYRNPVSNIISVVQSERVTVGHIRAK